MKRNLKTWMSAAIAMLCGACMMGCQQKATPKEDARQVATAASGETTYQDAIARYLTDEIGSQYAPGEVCIPCMSVIGVDETNEADVRVWGDYWVFNYQVAGDTLKTVSGGSHPGLIHLKKTTQGYQVTSMEVVEDGAGNLASAKRIFGDRYDAFHAVNSDQQKREAVRAKAISQYVKQHDMSVKLYQDFGWPAIALDLP